MVDVAPAAFVATVCRTIPSFIDRESSTSEASTGFLPAVLGARSFDRGNEQQRFAPFLQTGLRMASSLGLHWQAMQLEVEHAVDGPLSQPMAAAGANVKKLQHALTVQREQIRFQALDVQIRNLPPQDMRRAAWVNVDRFSTAWVSAWPTHDLQLSNPKFLEVSNSTLGCQAQHVPSWWVRESATRDL